MIECDAPADSEIATFFCLGNTRPGQKVPGLSFEDTVHRHRSAQGRTVKLHFYLGAIRRVLDAVHRNDHEMAVFCVFISLHSRGLGPTCAAGVGRTAHSVGASSTKLPSHCCMPVFTVSCLKHTVGGKAFEDEERSKVPPHSNLYCCTKRTAGGASGSGSAPGISLSK